MALHDEIRERRAEIRSDGYPMSIGELVNLYRDGELNIHPEFQRFFRWTATQKARLIESLLLGIPLPSIFVSQRDDGVWDVIDGLQRLSTIFEFMGVLKDEGDACVEPLVLVKTKYLPSLENRTWRDYETHKGIGSENQLIIKRSKIDVKIILRESSEGSKYELFQRLNTGGSQLSAQELRNVLMIMVDPTLYRWVSDLSGNQHFRSCLGISDRAELEQYDLELVCRFLVLRELDEPRLKGIPEFGEFLTESMLELAAASEREKREIHGNAFARTFEVLAEALADDSFRRYDHQRRRHLGRFLISAFEVIAMGLGFNVSRLGYQIDRERVQTVARDIWRDGKFLAAIGSGVGTSSRIPVTIPRGRALFA